MNPFSRFKNYIIGDAIAKTDDVFEKARIDLTFNITLFFLALGMMYYVNLIANNYTWFVYITTIAVVCLPMVLVVLKKTGNVKYAGYLFIAEQTVVGFSHMVLENFEFDEEGALWTMVVILFAFLVNGTRMGWAVTIYSVIIIFFGLCNEVTDYALFDFETPAEQLPESQPILVFLPLAICVYTIHRSVVTRKVAEAEINNQKKLVMNAHRLLESKNEDVISSIQYAKRIQEAVLPPEDRVQRDIPLSFIFYRPKDIVSGDFFWFHSLDANRYVLAVADCTGHGVPGAFMTVIGSNLLNQIVIENNMIAPGKILEELDLRLTSTLRQEKQHRGLVQDGMDIAIIYVDRTKKKIDFSSAKRPAIFVRDGKLEEFKGSKLSIGGLRTEQKHFEEISIAYEEDDCLYLYSDGIVDQFGGPQNKKLTTKRLRERIVEISELSVHDQSRQVEELFNSWKGAHEQTDDALMIGIRF
jgi:serine phosphatase RsbU (regulator of sigma subunit)